MIAWREVFSFLFRLPKTEVGVWQVAEKNLCSGCSKTSRCKAPEIPKSEAYIEVRRNDEEYG
jgi:hypothetical protein